MQTPSPSPDITVLGAEGAASSELVLFKEEGGVFWPLFKQQVKPGQRFMLAYNGQICQLYVTPPACGCSTPQRDCPEQDSNTCTGGMPERTCRKGSEAITVLLTTGQANEYETGSIAGVIASTVQGGNDQELHAQLCALALRQLRGLSIQSRPEGCTFWLGGINALCCMVDGGAAFMATRDALLLKNGQGSEPGAWASLTINAQGLPASQVQQALAAQGIHIAFEHIPNLHLKAAKHLKDVPVTIAAPLREYVAALRALVDHFNGIHEPIVTDARAEVPA